MAIFGVPDVALLAPSYSSMLLTSLKLLDLDLLPDWPSISVQTLSAKETSQNQKQRISSVEWVLYRLFEIWDPQEAREVRLTP